LQEITYLLTPPSQAPPPAAPMMTQEMNAAPQFGHQQSSRDMEDAYLQQQRQQNQQKMMASLGQPGPSPNHQPPPIPSVPESSRDLSSSLHASQMQLSRSLADQQPLPQGPVMDNVPSNYNQREEPSFFPDEPVEKITHQFDGYGRPVVPSGAEEASNTALTVNSDEESTGSSNSGADNDAWDFSDPPRSPESANTDPNPPLGPENLPNSNHVQSKSPVKFGSRRKGSMSRRKSGEHEVGESRSPQLGANASAGHMKADSTDFKVRFALRGHLDVVRAVIFTGGGSPSEPEICTAGDDGVIKRWFLPANYGRVEKTAKDKLKPSHSEPAYDLDISSYFTHRGHTGIVTSLTSCPSPEISGGGRAAGDGWIFSGGQDTTVRVWERGRVDPKATLDGHTDAVWTVQILPGSAYSVFGNSSPFGNQINQDKVLLASGSADGTVKIWAVSAPQSSSPTPAGRRGVGGSRRHSVSSGSNFPSSPQPSTATTKPFNYSLLHTISRPDLTASPTCISPLSNLGQTFIVSYNDAAILVYDTRTGEEVVNMQSLETYDGKPDTAVNAVVATTQGLEGVGASDSGRGLSDEAGATGMSIEGVVISGHEDRYIRFFDANSGKKSPATHHLCPPSFLAFLANIVLQVNARTICSRILRLSPRYPFPQMAVN
jgi:striatin 1/3/4